MKICFIIPKSYPLFNSQIRSTFGGAEVQLTLIGKELAKQKRLDINFMVADYGQKNVEEYNGVKVWKSVNFKHGMVKQILDFYRIYRRINADVYIQQTLTPFSGLIAFYCKLTNKKFVFILANDGEADGSHRVYKNTPSNFLANLVFRFAYLIVSQNNYQKSKLDERKISSEIIKAGYFITKSSHQKKNFILWVARSEKIKRPTLFLKLAEANPTKNFLMICPAATNKEKFFEKVKKKSKEIKNLRFMDFVPFYRIDKYFQEARIFVNTSIQEGFPNTFIQAAINKIPIISLNVDPDNFLTEFKCGFYCGNNFDLMNNHLNELMNNGILYKKMSQNAFEYAKNTHDIKRISTQLFKYIKIKNTSSYRMEIRN